jgi:hypothetical protein
MTLGALLAGACGSTTDPPRDQPAPVTRFTATIDNAAWSATRVTAITHGDGDYTIIAPASGTRHAMLIALHAVTSARSYPLGALPASGGGIVQMLSGGTAFALAAPEAASAIEMTTVSATRIAGTFRFSMPSAPGQAPAAGPIVTAGQFDLPLVAAENLLDRVRFTHIFSALITDSLSTGSTVTLTRSPADGALGASSGDFIRFITLSLGGVNATGVYSIGNDSTRVVRVQKSGVSWGGSSATNTGSLIITSFTATRIRGMVAAILKPSIGFTPNPDNAILGMFDLALF